MGVGKFLSKVVEKLPSWEVTKYYGRVCWFHVQCLKYRIQTSEAWFNFMNKYMPGRLRNEAEQADKCSAAKGKQVQRSGKMPAGTKDSSLANELLAKIPKSAFLKEKLEKLLANRKKAKEEESSQVKSEVIRTKSAKDATKSNPSKSKQQK